MGGFKSRPAPAPVQVAQQEVSEVQERQEERAEAQEVKQQQGVQRRRRLRRRGGMRLLFSPLRQEGPGAKGSSKLGGGS